MSGTVAQRNARRERRARIEMLRRLRGDELLRRKLLRDRITISDNKLAKFDALLEEALEMEETI